MFETGKTYEFTTLNDDVGVSRVEGTWTGTVTRYQHPLLELDDGTILNVECDRFVKAAPRD